MTIHTWSRTALMLIAMCLSPAALRAEKKPVELKWSELQPLVRTHQVAVTLNNGQTVRGEALAVREDALVLDTHTGNSTVPRNDIVSVDVRRTRGSWGRTLGTTLGILAGFSLGGWTAFHIDGGGKALTVFTIMTSGIAVGGYYAGRELDKRTTRIVIVP